MHIVLTVTLAIVVGYQNDGDEHPKFRRWHEAEQAVEAFRVAHIYCDVACGCSKP